MADINTTWILCNNLERSDSGTNFLDPYPCDPIAYMGAVVHEFVGGLKKGDLVSIRPKIYINSGTYSFT